MLMDAPALDLSCEPHLLHSQARLDRVISIPIRGGDAKVYLSDLRALAALTLFCGFPEDLGELPDSIRAAFVTYAEDRERIERERQASAEWRKGPRVRTYVGAPKSTALLAAIVPGAVAALDAEPEDAPAPEVRALAARLVTRRSDRWTVLRQFGFSPRLQALFRTALVPTLKFDRGAGTLSRSGDRLPRAYAFQPRHVPQLFPEAEFAENFARYFPGIRQNHARRFCSVAMVRLCGVGTWRAAASSLDLPVSAAAGMANRAVGILKKCGAYEFFARDLHEAAARLAERPGTDYGRRRELCAGFDDIPAGEWRKICRAADVQPGLAGGRSRYAAAWLWADLTGGDWTLAPALASGDSQNRRIAFQRLNQTVFPALAPFLRIYGDQLLAALEIRY
jgi:hypothetical protein